MPTRAIFQPWGTNTPNFVAMIARLLTPDYELILCGITLIYLILCHAITVPSLLAPNYRKKARLCMTLKAKPREALFVRRSHTGHPSYRHPMVGIVTRQHK